jgi:hypothetical protein
MAEKGVLPLDHHDPNHPHYPGDLEHQSVGRRSMSTQKRILIAVAIALTLSLTGIIIWAVAVTRTHHNVVAAPEATVTVSSSPTASLEVQTVFENATTVIYTTTHVPKLFIPDLATVTVTMSPTLVSAEAPLRPIFTKKSLTAATATATINVLTSAPAPTVSDPAGCSTSGNWPSKSPCDQNCPAWSGHSTHCDTDAHAHWVCVSCPL